ncbi:MAG: fasciclin domain-containing protein [Rhodothermales bacterium]
MKPTTFPLAALLALLLAAPVSLAQGDAAELQAQAAQEDIVTTLVDRGDFTILVDALRSTGLDAALASGEAFTLFAPTDAAFAKLPAGTLEGLTPEQLTGILRYHVLVGAASSEDAAALDAAPSVQGSDLTFYASDAGLTVNGAAITEADVQASNGVIHVIDTVLLPEADAPMDDDMMDEEMHEEHMDKEMMDDADTSADQSLPTDDQR